MAISDLYSSGFRDRNRDHFAAIVRVALSDGTIEEKERSFLDRMAQNLSISPEEFDEILKNPNLYPVNPPVSYDSRLERLYDISKMVNADSITDEDEKTMMDRLGVGLGFTPANVSYVTSKALELVRSEVTLEVFKEEIRFMNR